MCMYVTVCILCDAVHETILFHFENTHQSLCLTELNEVVWLCNNMLCTISRDLSIVELTTVVQYLNGNKLTSLPQLTIINLISHNSSICLFD